MEGFAEKNGRGSDYDLSNAKVFDLLDEAEFMAMVDMRARKGRVSFDVDMIFLKFENLTLGDLAARNPLPRANIDLDMELEQLVVRFGGGYTICEGLTPFTGKEYRLDLQAGGRYMYLDGSGVLSGPRREVGFDGNENFIEPWIGAETQVEVCDRVSLVLGGNVGGFGVRNSPEQNWEVYGNLLYQVTPRVSLNLGYRHLDVTYEEGSSTGARKINMELDGPVAGMTFRF